MKVTNLPSGWKVKVKSECWSSTRVRVRSFSKNRVKVANIPTGWKIECESECQSLPTVCSRVKSESEGLIGFTITKEC